MGREEHARGALEKLRSDTKKWIVKYEDRHKSLMWELEVTQKELVHY